MTAEVKVSIKGVGDVPVVDSAAQTVEIPYVAPVYAPVVVEPTPPVVVDPPVVYVAPVDPTPPAVVDPPVVYVAPVDPTPPAVVDPAVVPPAVVTVTTTFLPTSGYTFYQGTDSNPWSGSLAVRNDLANQIQVLKDWCNARADCVAFTSDGEMKKRLWDPIRWVKGSPKFPGSTQGLYVKQ